MEHASGSQGEGEERRGRSCWIGWAKPRVALDVPLGSRTRHGTRLCHASITAREWNRSAKDIGTSALSVAPTTEEGASKLKLLLGREAQVAEKIVEYMVTTLKMESVPDFAGFFTKGEVAAGVFKDILGKITEFKEDSIQRARLRTAWEMAQVEVAKSIGKKSRGDAGEDWDAPLDPDTQKQQEADFYRLYHMKFEADVSPSDVLFGRLRREFRRTCITVTPLNKVRSAAQAAIIFGHSKRQRIAEGVTITYNEDTAESGYKDASFATILQVLWALKVFCVGWGMTGTAERDSLAKPGTKVRDGDLSEGFAYLDFCQAQAMQHPGSRVAGAGRELAPRAGQTD